MNALAWVLGIGIFVGLLIAFPKRTGIFLCVVVGSSLVIGLGTWGVFQFIEYRKQQVLARVKISADYNLQSCDEEFPILVSIKNETGQTIENTKLQLAGYRRNHSDPLYSSGYLAYESDRIIPSDTSASACWRTPTARYDASEATLRDHPPESLIWRVTDFRVEYSDD